MIVLLKNNMSLSRNMIEDFWNRISFNTISNNKLMVFMKFVDVSRY